MFLLNLEMQIFVIILSVILFDILNILISDI